MFFFVYMSCFNLSISLSLIQRLFLFLITMSFMTPRTIELQIVEAFYNFIFHNRLFFFSFYSRNETLHSKKKKINKPNENFYLKRPNRRSWKNQFFPPSLSMCCVSLLFFPYNNSRPFSHDRVRKKKKKPNTVYYIFNKQIFLKHFARNFLLHFNQIIDKLLL